MGQYSRNNNPDNSTYSYSSIDVVIKNENIWFRDKKR